MHCNQSIWSRGNYGIVNDLFKMKGQEASSWLKMRTRKKLSLRYSLIQCSTILARCRREKIISFTLDKDGTLIWPLGLEPPAGLGGSEMLSRGGGVKNGLQGGRIAIYPPHAHLCI